MLNAVLLTASQALYATWGFSRPQHFCEEWKRALLQTFSQPWLLRIFGFPFNIKHNLTVEWGHYFGGFLCWFSSSNGSGLWKKKKDATIGRNFSGFSPSNTVWFFSLPASVSPDASLRSLTQVSFLGHRQVDLISCLPPKSALLFLCL